MIQSSLHKLFSTDSFQVFLCGLFLCLFIGSHSTSANEIELHLLREKIYVNYNDQQVMKDIHFTKYGIFMVHSYFNAHRGITGARAYYHSYEGELNNNDPYQFNGKLLLGHDYTTLGRNYEKIIIVPEKEWLQYRIVQFEDTIHLPDNNDHSYQYTLDGDYIGYESNFSALEEKHKSTLQIGDATATIPVTLFNKTYTELIELKTTWILVSENFYSIVGKKELIEDGVNAKPIEIPRSFTNDDLSFPLQIHALPNDYFFTTVKTTPLRLFRARNGEVQEFKIHNAPLIRDPSYFYLNNGYLYHILIEGNPINLDLYEITGIDITSSLVSHLWTELK